MKTIQHQTPSKKLNVTQTIAKSPVDITKKDIMSNSMVSESSDKIPSEYYSLRDTLASQFIYYPFKDLHMRKFSVEEIFQINYAHLTGSFRPIAQAINNCIYEKDIDVLNLTRQDVKQLMYWQKINSYFKHDFEFEVICVDQAHQLKVANGELPVESMIMKHVFSTSEIKIDVINPELASEGFSTLVERYQLEFVPESFKDFIEYEELLTEMIEKSGVENPTEDDISPEDLNTLYIARFAKFLSPIHGDSLKEKIEFFRVIKKPPTILQDIIDYQEKCYHSVKEQVTTTCKECGGLTTTTLSIDPHTFFPNI